MKNKSYIINAEKPCFEHLLHVCYVQGSKAEEENIKADREKAPVNLSHSSAPSYGRIWTQGEPVRIVTVGGL